ncbi:3'-5' exonuclease [Saccharothrix sp. BKS2]|uniref:3'-5' exonuclease n=1 Tax=Saccharothrix sp. BKS2 TaxID=3064400 RepID=UPI0039EAEA6B
MRILQPVEPTAEQLTVLRHTKPGVALIKGAAGSGKTTTALYRLKLLCGQWLARRRRLGLEAPVRVLVMTYNRTLEGYIAELARQQVQGDEHLELTVTTFSKWALGLLPVQPQTLDFEDVGTMLRRLARELPGNPDFWAEEVDYLLGRFPSDHLDSYLTVRREGRGTSPRVDHALRQRLLEEVVLPYQEAKRSSSTMDWNDVALAAGAVTGMPPWDVVIIDEAQDFSANQIRSVLTHLAEPHSMTFVMDAAQRIYPRFFTWNEVGITIPSASNTTLKVNYRNTRQIAAFAQPLVEGLPLDGDGQIPDFTSCTTDGPLPTVVAGTYSAQMDYILGSLSQTVDFANESVVFLQPFGGRWFDYLRERLERVKIPYVQLTRKSSWPTGSEAIALCTLHSAKGLEFDHVVLPGLNQQVTPHGDEPGDVYLDRLRRLIAMGVGRARKSVHIGFKPNDPSRVLSLLKPDTYTLVTP